MKLPIIAFWAEDWKAAIENMPLEVDEEKM